MVLMLCTIQLCAQNETGLKLEQYLFPEFSKTRVKMKAGKDLTLLLNYNTVTETMVFLQNGQFFDMTNQEAVDTVYLNTRMFIPHGNAFFEVVVNGPVSFFIQHKSDLRSPGMPAGYGGTTELAAAKYVSNIKVSGAMYNVKLPTDYIINPSPVEWVRINDDFSSFFNERQFLKIFPEKVDQLNKFIKASKIKVINRDDLIKLGNYCNEIMR
jgi:hypothetical protein